MSRHWLGIDFDWTLWDTGAKKPMPGAQEALDAFHERGWRVMVHSCNSPTFIREMCEKHRLSVDAIWGEGPADVGCKPICSAYVDDRGFRFTGDWSKDVPAIIEQVLDRERNPKSRPQVCRRTEDEGGKVG